MDVAHRVFIRWMARSAEAQKYAQGRGWSYWLGEDEDGARTPGTIAQAMLGYSGEGSQAEREEMRRELERAGVELDSPIAVAILGYTGDVAGWAKRHEIEHLQDEWVLKGYIPGMMGRKRLVYPHARNGRIIYLSGRSIDVKFHYNLPEPLAGKRQPYYNQVYKSGADVCVVVEGQADAVTLGQWGVSGLALAGVTPDDGLCDALQRHGTLYVGLDADKVGNKSAWKVAEQLGPLVRLLNWGRARKTAKIRVGNGKEKAAENVDELVQAAAQERLCGEERPEITVNLLKLLPRLKDEHGWERPAITGEDGRLALVTTATDLLLGIVQMYVNAEEAAHIEAAWMRELLDWAPSVIGWSTEGQRMVKAVKDANDLLIAFQQAGEPEETQRTRVQQELLGQAQTYVESICTWAGKQEGAARDEAMPRAISVVGRLDEFQLNQYRKDLAKLLGVQLREMQAMLKALATKEERERSEGEPQYVWGGLINGWMVEYLYDQEHDQALLAWRSPEGKVGSGAELVIGGKKYLPYPQNETLRSGAISFASALGEKRSIRELVAYLELYLKSIYIFPSEQLVRLTAYWVLSTWIYDAFETVIYLRAMGGAGAGKSELVKRIGLVCYRTMTANGAGSTSALFRAVERYKSTVLLDEADLDQSDTEADMIKFYNLGAMKGGVIWRTVEVKSPNGEKDWEERSFQTFCPKLIAMRKDFKDDAVGSRSLTLKLVPREMTELVAAGIPLSVTQSVRARAQALRNLLLRWRMETWESEIMVDASYYDLTISPRLNQVAGPLLAIAKDDPEQQEDIRRTLREYYQESILNQSMTLGARVIEALWKIWLMPDLHKQMVRTEPDGSQVIKIGDVTRITNEIINVMNDEEEGDDDDDKFRKARELKSQRVGRILRSDLALKVSQRRRDGFFVYWNEPRLQGLSSKYGVTPDDFGPTENGKGSTATAKPMEQSSLL